MSTDPSAMIRNSPLRHVNPVTRLLVVVLLSLPALISLDWVSSLVLFACCLLGAVLLGLLGRQLALRLLPLLIAAPIASISMALYAKPGGRIHLHWGLIQVSDQSLWWALAVFIRVFALGFPSMVLLTSMSATALADGLAQLVRLPARVVLGTLAGGRMIGLFLDDWRTLGQARRARGLGDTGRIRRLFTMAFTLLVFAIRRGSRLATAMQARGFGQGARTWARPSRLGPADAVAVLVTLAICAVSLVAAHLAGTLNILWA